MKLERYKNIFGPRMALQEEFECHILDTGEEILYLYFLKDDSNTRQLVEKNLRGEIELTGKYSLTKHPPHTPPPEGKPHIHVYAGNNQIFALNNDGTARDQSHGILIPKKVATAIKKVLNGKDWVIPENGLIETIGVTELKKRLLD